MLGQGDQDTARTALDGSLDSSQKLAKALVYYTAEKGKGHGGLDQGKTWIESPSSCSKDISEVYAGVRWVHSSITGKDCLSSRRGREATQEHMVRVLILFAVVELLHRLRCVEEES